MPRNRFGRLRAVYRPTYQIEVTRFAQEVTGVSIVIAVPLTASGARRANLQCLRHGGAGAPFRPGATQRLMLYPFDGRVLAEDLIALFDRAGVFVERPLWPRTSGGAPPR